MSIDARTQYHNAPEGCGAILNFGKQHTNGSQDIEGCSVCFVGTYGVRTCVGLYVRISGTQCLLVHINAIVGAHKSAQTAPGNRRTTEKQGEVLYQRFLTKLKFTASSIGWTVTGLESVTMCCPMPEKDFDSEQEPVLYTGHFIVKAIRDFLNRPTLEARILEGFIVDQRTGLVRVTASYVEETFDACANLAPPEMIPYVRQDIPDDGTWYLEI